MHSKTERLLTYSFCVESLWFHQTLELRKFTPHSVVFTEIYSRAFLASLNSVKSTVLPKKLQEFDKNFVKTTFLL